MSGAKTLADLGISGMRLLTGSRARRAGLEGYGLRVVERIRLDGVEPDRPTVRVRGAG